MTDWMNPFGMTDESWQQATWPEKFSLVNPFFWRY